MLTRVVLERLVATSIAQGDWLVNALVDRENASFLLFRDGLAGDRSRQRGRCRTGRSTR